MIAGAEVFLDTNILLYAAGGKVREPRKHDVAQGLLSSKFGLSTQVLAEFFWNATRKGPKPLSHDDAAQWVMVLAKKPVQVLDLPIVQSAINLSGRYKITYWDGAIIAAAEAIGATTLYSEDLNHGQTYGRVKVVNPFLEPSS